jgi:MerR family copper efflux transcriptional regulator
MATETLLKIGELHAQSGVPIKTIRYYEEIGLIAAKERTSGGFRLFSPDVLTRLNFIKRSQRLGLSLQEIGELLQIYDSGQLPCREVKHKFAEKITEIDRHIAELKVLKQELLSLISVSDFQTSDSGNNVICPIIQKL